MNNIKNVLSYDKDTGEFTWMESRGNIAKGSKAGYVDKGYVKIRYNKKNYKAHRLAWFFEYGKFPTKVIDHINHDGTDNRISNLREVNHRENLQNCSKYKSNTSGTTGVAYHKRDNVWYATIRLNGKQTHLGNFQTEDEAKLARQEAEVKYRFHENHGKQLGLEK